MDTVSLIASLISRLALLAIQYVQAQQAGDQASLDAIKAQAVSASNALAPPDAEPPVVVV